MCRGRSRSNLAADSAVSDQSLLIESSEYKQHALGGMSIPYFPFFLFPILPLGRFIVEADIARMSAGRNFPSLQRRKDCTAFFLYM